LAFANMFKRRKRDDIGFVSDPGRRAEDWSIAEIEAEFASRSSWAGRSACTLTAIGRG